MPCSFCSPKILDDFFYSPIARNGSATGKKRQENALSGINFADFFSFLVSLVRPSLFSILT
jgi:hypothetical protein